MCQDREGAWNSSGRAGLKLQDLSRLSYGPRQTDLGWRESLFSVMPGYASWLPSGAIWGTLPATGSVDFSV